ncbi:MAG: C-type lectin domain-containing protein [Oscillospiraceae bacterium]|nr:C-type lectin domain-containing protein [Oscillospiraceae bacterium]
MAPTFTPPPGFTPPPSRGGSLGSRTSVPGSSGNSLGGSGSFTPPPSSGGFTPPPPPASAPAFGPPPAGGYVENYVPNKIKFPKWLRAADVFLVIAAVGTGFLLYNAYSQRVEQNRLAEAAERAAQMQATSEKTTYITSEIPFPGKRFLIFRNSRNELMAAVVDAPNDARITWDKGITIDKRDSEVAQFQMKKDGTWKSLGNFGHLTEYAKELVAGNTKVYDKDGNIVFEATMCKNQHFYQLYEESVPWSAAKSACEANGGHLVSITNLNEQAFVAQIANARYLWTGGCLDTKNTDKWYWAGTDERFIFLNWSEGQPAAGGDRLVLGAEGWQAVKSSGMKTEGYLCEWNADDLMETFEALRKK